MKLKIKSRRCLIVCLLLIVLLFFFLISSIDVNYNLSAFPQTKFNKIDPIEKDLNNDTKKILLYTKFFGHSWYMKRGSSQFKNCEFTNCYITENYNEFETFSEFDAVVFHLEDLQKMFIYKSSFDYLRQPHQRFVAFLLESPSMAYFNRFRQFNGFFNWTMTYRRDSDIFSPYGSINPKIKGYKPTYDASTFNYNNLSKSTQKLWHRPKSILWMVSNCNSYSKREKLVKKLKNYINIDVYGKCGSLSCQRFTNCDDELKKTYRFYLSFENSICDDYVTEKLYDRMNYEMLPIVYGGANYSYFAPDHSYIRVQDYESPKELANKILQIETNITEYLSYFWWKEHYKVDTERLLTTGFCNLCKKLHSKEASEKAYNDLYDWFHFKPITHENICSNKPFI